MVRSTPLVLALLLGGCATTAQVASAPPAATYHSARAREVVADCLMNRVTTADVLPRKAEAGSTTTIEFVDHGGLHNTAIYVFAIADSGSGSSIEAHRYAHASLAAAETCF